MGRLLGEAKGLFWKEVSGFSKRRSRTPMSYGLRDVFPELDLAWL